MTSPQRIQLQRTKGWRTPTGVIIVARPSRWGNPWSVGDIVHRTIAGTQHGIAGNYTAADRRWYETSDLAIYPPGDRRSRLTATEAVALYRDELEGNLADGDSDFDELRAALALLAGHDLGCWCPLDEPCHADVLLEAANR